MEREIAMHRWRQMVPQNGLEMQMQMRMTVTPTSMQERERRRKIRLDEKIRPQMGAAWIRDNKRPKLDCAWKSDLTRNTPAAPAVSMQCAPWSLRHS
jgi:hypothetical protein